MNERFRTDYGYNLHISKLVECEQDEYAMPLIKKINVYPSSLIGFNYAKTSKKHDNGVHFYLDDYQFERVWNQPERYLDILRKFNFVFTPDFSLYMDMPMPLQIYNIYRSRLLGAYWQRKGINVVPTISWSGENSYNFAFSGVEQGGVITVSTVGVARNKEATQNWINGMHEMIKQIKPKTILVYGKPIEFDYKEIEVIYYNNTNNERMKKWVEEERQALVQADLAQETEQPMQSYLA